MLFQRVFWVAETFRFPKSEILEGEFHSFGGLKKMLVSQSFFSFCLLFKTLDCSRVVIFLVVKVSFGQLKYYKKHFFCLRKSQKVKIRNQFRRIWVKKKSWISWGTILKKELFWWKTLCLVKVLKTTLKLLLVTTTLFFAF